MMDGLSQLEQRILELDAEPFDRRAPRGPYADLTRFLSVLERATSTGAPKDVHSLPCVSATDTDTMLKSCRLLARLAIAAPEIVTGPLRLDSQYWIHADKPSWLPKREPTLSESHFIGVPDAPTIEVSTKPFDVGLFTSTGVLGTHGMWRAYLDQFRGSALHPLPWHTWAVEPRHGAAVREITSAAEWVDLVLSHPLRERGLIFPDWKSVARRCDAVHMTLRAIAATQGLYFSSEQGIVATTYWHMESTLWLRWCFDSVRLVETVT